MNWKIKSFLIAVLCLLVLAVSMNTRRIDANTVVSPISDAEMITAAMQSVVAVYHPSVNIPASGFYIGNGIIVTAGHVAKTEGLERVIFENGDEYKIIEQIVHPDYDCGFLIIEDIDKPALKFDDEQIERGNILFVSGNPRGYIFVISKGIMSGYTDCGGYFGDITLLVYDCATTNGNSGSPVVDDEGEVVAVHVGGNGTGFNVGICKSDILKALDAAGLEID